MIQSRILKGFGRLNNGNHTLMMLLSLFSYALLLHYGISWISPVTTAAILILCVLQLISNKFWWCSILAIIITSRTYFIDFPRQPNHANIETFIGIVLLGAVFYRYLTGRRPSNEVINSCFRWVLISVYFWAGFHKLNAGFFAENGSCAIYISNTFNSMIVGSEYAPRGVMLLFFQVATVVFEMVVPFGILFSKTRKAAVALLVFFHLYLSLCNFSNFSALAGFLIFGSVMDYGTQYKSLQTKYKVYQLCAIVAVITAYFTNPLIPEMEHIRIIKNLIFSVGWLVLFIPAIMKVSNRHYHNTVLPSSIVIFLVSLWAFQPYIGLSNSGNLSMFSNLVTEKRRSNHYIINTRYTKIFNYEEDFVTVLDTPEEGKYLIGYDVPINEFKSHVKYWIQKSSKSKLSATIIYKEKIIEIEDLRASNFSEPEWWGKYIVYRPIPRDGNNECKW